MRSIAIVLLSASVSFGAAIPIPLPGGLSVDLGSEQPDPVLHLIDPMNNDHSSQQLSGEQGWAASVENLFTLSGDLRLSAIDVLATLITDATYDDSPTQPTFFVEDLVINDVSVITSVNDSPASLDNGFLGGRILLPVEGDYKFVATATFGTETITSQPIFWVAIPEPSTMLIPALAFAVLARSNAGPRRCLQGSRSR